MPNEVLTFTPLQYCFETEERRRKRKLNENMAAQRVAKCLSQCGIYNMERLNSMTREEILAVSGVKKTDYRYVEEALEDFRAEYGDLKWKMPDFVGIELGYIIHVLTYRKIEHYFDLYRIFNELAEPRNRHPLIDVMARIYIKIRTIERDEFATIMAAKGVNIEDYGI